jgi:hypothetical protein
MDSGRVRPSYPDALLDAVVVLVEHGGNGAVRFVVESV